MTTIEVYALLKNKIEAVDTAVSELAPGYTFKGSVSTTSALPSSAEIGDLYIVTGEGYNSQYVWDGTEWLFIGRTNVQINAFNV